MNREARALAGSAFSRGEQHEDSVSVLRGPSAAKENWGRRKLRFGRAEARGAWWSLACDPMIYTARRAAKCIRLANEGLQSSDGFWSLVS